MIKKYTKGIGFSYKEKLGICFRITTKFKIKIWKEKDEIMNLYCVNIGKLGFGIGYKTK